MPPREWYCTDAGIYRALIGDLYGIYMYWNCSPVAKGRQAVRGTDGSIGAGTRWRCVVRQFQAGDFGYLGLVIFRQRSKPFGSGRV